MNFVRLCRLQACRCLFVSTFAIFFVRPAFATIYECTPEQEIGWVHGKLQPTSKDKLVERLRFDDETAVLWDAPTPAVLPSPVQFQIMQKISPDYDLVAVATIGDKPTFIASEQIRIRSWDAKAGLIYVYTGGQAISAGHCIIARAEH